ncbi:MAG TPA: hypothetical protein VK501_23905 [Baekduia sp.]|uniref:hypothetical protein n=1 Tax=Baekduia sp. TaxID=2600305 RepID=UPI002B6A70C9|nr:hypothetical protein [Baekduia sp.]HMJ36972.1 hypothetical protein [Baekduia sp.]
MLSLSPAFAQDVSTETVLDTVNASTPVSAYGGVAVWSTFDEASKTYRLRAYRNGQVTTLPIPARRGSFDADVGPDASGQPVVVYSRCRGETGGLGLAFNELPEWAFARGCDVHRFRFADGSDRVLAVASSSVRSEVTPSIWGSRLAYFAIDEPRHGRRSIGGRLYLADLRGHARTLRFTGGTRGPLSRVGSKLVDGPSPTGLDLAGTAMTFGWSNLRSCQGEPDSGGDAQASEIWRQTLTSRARLARSCTAYGVFGPFIAGSDVQWVTQVKSAVRGAAVLSSLLPGADKPLPAYTRGVALDGGNLIVARGTLTGPMQIVAIPAS